MTIEPEIRTGSKFATGVIAPVLPTLNEIELNLVIRFSALNLYAIAHLGNLEVNPNFF